MQHIPSQLCCKADTSRQALLGAGLLVNQEGAQGLKAGGRYNTDKPRMLTFGDNTLISSFRKRNLATSLWNFSPQWFTHISSTCTDTGAHEKRKTMGFRAHLTADEHLLEPWLVFPQDGKDTKV